ncbi:MAG: ABC transporter permease [Bradymonadales bacterium]|nr:ABC transporter permease [Bradymonadales bacterium]
MSDEQRALTKIISPGRGSFWGELLECWRNREFLGFLAWRDVKVRYSQTVLGMAWAVIQPLTHMVIFTMIFNKVAGLQSPEGIPYPVYTFAALLPWQLFTTALTRSSESVVAEARLLTKVYFPRLLVPFSAMSVGLIDFCVSFVILLLMMVGYGITPSWTIVFLPLFVLLTLMTALAVGLFLAAMNAKYRDFRHVVPFMISIWMFITPVAYPASAIIRKIPAGWGWIYNLNPMTGVVEGFRWALVGQTGLAPGMLAVSSAAVVVVFILGLMYFRRMERSFADVL